MLLRLQGTGNAGIGLATGLAGFSAIFLLLFLLTKHDSLVSPGRVGSLNLARGFLNQIQGKTVSTAIWIIQCCVELKRKPSCRKSTDISFETMRVVQDLSLLFPVSASRSADKSE